MKVFACTLLIFAFVATASAMPLTDVFIATEAEARSLRPEDQPLTKYVGADIKGVDVIKLEQLLRLGQGRSFDSKLKHFPKFVDLSEEGPWILRFSTALEQFLIGLDEKQIATWGERWSQIEEFKLDRFTSSDVTDVLRALVRVARQARESKKPIFIWMSL